MTKRILVVEDDQSIARLLCDNLVFEGFEVECAVDGLQALETAKRFGPDLVLLDLMLPPGVDGFELCQMFGQSEKRTAVIVLTARGQREDRVRGLKLGADDYISKPFALDELLARVHAVLRRTQRLVDRIVLGEIAIDFTQLRATRGGEELTSPIASSRSCGTSPSTRASRSRATSCCGPSGAIRRSRPPGPWTASSSGCGTRSSPIPTTRSTSGRPTATATA